ncbi:peptidase S9A prolyl oligopeptidase domain protein beta-propeller [Thamnocephalis sphaerospora]|uniref:Prolyl endopeptidase n=1 Tax=Thamnocephalis sphaerospora TaxID=78915 RepID=A0A4P9XVP6_9FUNG|nr:peptidase S9A prolyl oligopeptidase domain protein beta-propeller [Thamnocephalis sphaerospora]|eukprot:RKP10355.1 peptidase S9A prolyl oligopeptidase domain protein beta-propeller [Thamnocephalis sphaerospora]
MPHCSHPVPSRLAEPLAKAVPFSHHYHHQDYPDPYHWMRDDERRRADVLTHLEAENHYANATLRGSKLLQDTVYSEFASRIPADDRSVEWQYGDYWYYWKHTPGQQMDTHYRRHVNATHAHEEKVLDLNQVSDKHVNLGSFRPSLDGQLLAYAVDTTGAEMYTIYIRNLTDGTLLADMIPNTAGDLEWDAHGRFLFYTTLDSIARPSRVLRHRLGTHVQDDVVLFREDDQQFSISIRTSNSQRYIFVNSGSLQTTEHYYLAADQPTEPLRLFHPRLFDHQYEIEHLNSQFVILANRINGGEKLINAAVYACDANGPTGMAHWSLVLAHDPRVLLEKLLPSQHHLAVLERANGLQQLRIIDLDQRGRLTPEGQQHYVNFPEQAYSVDVNTRQPAYATDSVRFVYSSLVTPDITYDYSMATRRRAVRHRTNAPGYNPALYTTERIYLDRSPADVPTSLPADLKIPITIAYRRNLLRKDGSNPAWLTGYGSYGMPLDPSFTRESVSLLDRGYVNGRGWYELEGKFLNKRNTFRDFIAAAEKLFADGYTRKELLAIEARSAGGMLAGAVMNLRPDLAKVAVVGVPFVDIINTMMDASIPLTVNEYEEWGNPNNITFFNYMRSYSPYDNVRDNTKYPNMLIRAGLHDPRVAFWEAAKWSAKLRASNARGHPCDVDPHVILLLTSMDSGHFGSSGRYAQLRESAADYAFVISKLQASYQRLFPHVPVARRWVS